ncbi:unnamed protein product, partial [Porites evermanni]
QIKQIKVSNLLFISAFLQLEHKGNLHWGESTRPEAWFVSTCEGSIALRLLQKVIREDLKGKSGRLQGLLSSQYGMYLKCLQKPRSLVGSKQAKPSDP